MTGSGTLADPYVIWDVNDLQDVGNGAPYGLGDYYELGQDIDATATAGWNWNAGRGVFEGFRPIILAAPYFTGLFDGKGHSIDSLYINRDVSNTSMFGYVTDCVISNVTLSNVDISGPAGLRRAALAGYIRGASVISNCHSSGRIDSGDNICAGLLGRVRDTTEVRNCSSSCDVTGAGTWSAGLIGNADGAVLIENCFATGAVTGTNYGCGGLVGQIGWASTVIVRDCYATGEIINHNAPLSHAGGLIGEFQGGAGAKAIIRCYATGNVTGLGDNVGGLIGDSDANVLIDQCYATGDVSGGAAWGTGGLAGGLEHIMRNSYALGTVTCTGEKVGGLVGYNTGTIENCYSQGQVIGGPIDIGGLVGRNNGGTVTNSFWDIETSGQATSDGGTGKTTAEMKMLETFLAAGWDIEAHTTLNLSSGYPFLHWQTPGPSPIWYIYLAITPPTPPPIPNVVTLPATEMR